MTKRGERLVRPVARQEWDLVVITGDAARGWDAFAISEPTALAHAYDQLTRDPAKHSERQHRLKGSLATGEHQGRTFDRWQYEVTGAGRIWYFIDDPGPERRGGKGARARRRVLVEMVSIGHPKATDR